MTRAEKAKAYFLQGYNCSQAVALAFSDMLDMGENQIARAVSGFGGGIGRMREVCGSVSGAVFVISNLYGYENPNDFNGKKQLYSDIQSFCRQFKDENGSIICRELLGITDGTGSSVPEERNSAYYKRRPCPEIVECAAKILENFLKNKEH